MKRPFSCGNNENFWRRRWQLDTIVPEDPESILLVARRGTYIKQETSRWEVSVDDRWFDVTENKKWTDFRDAVKLLNGMDVGMTESW